MVDFATLPDDASTTGNERLIAKNGDGAPVYIPANRFPLLNASGRVPEAQAPRRTRARALVLVGDSQMANAYVNATPSAVSYDNVTGVLTCTITGSGTYTGLDARVTVKGIPAWETRGVTITRLTNDTFTVPLAPGLGAVPSASLFRVHYQTQYQEANPFVWVSGARPRLVNHGVNAETIEDIDLRIDRICALPETDVWIRAGSNVSYSGDAAGGVLGAATIRTWVIKLLDAGKHNIIISTCPPVLSTIENARYVLALNEGIRKIATEFGLWLIDEYAIMVDPASATGAARTGFTSDSLHFSSRGSRAIAPRLQEIMDRIYGRTFANAPMSVVDSYDATNNPNAKNLMANALLTTASGGQNGNPTEVTGTIASGLTIYASGGWSAGAVVASVVPAATGFGNAQRLVATPTTAGQNMRITARQGGTTLAGRLVAGRKYRAVGNVRLSGITGQNVVRSLVLFVVFTNGEVSGATRIADHNWNATDVAQYEQSDFNIDFETPDFTLPPGVTEIYQDYRLTFGAAGTAVTFEVAEFGLIDVT